MSVMDMNSRMAMAEKLSIPQLQQAIQAGSLPAYIGIPLIEQKVKAQKQAAVPQQQPQKPIAQEVMEQASGIDSVPSNLPISGYAGGGIASFAEGGDVDDDFDYEEYLEQQEQDEYEDAIKRYMAEAEAAGIEGIPINRTKKVEQRFADGGIASFYNGGAIDAANAALGMGDLEQINPILQRTNVPQPTRFLADAERLREDPAYRAFAEQGGLNGDARYETYLAEGNNPAILAGGPEYEPAAPTSPAGDMARDVYSRVTTGLKDRFSPERQAQEDYIRREGVKSGIFGVGTDYDRATAEANVRKTQEELSQRPGNTAMTAAGSLREIVPPSLIPSLNQAPTADATPTKPATPRSTAFMNMEDTAGTTYVPRKPVGGTGTAGAPSSSSAAGAARSGSVSGSPSGASIGSQRTSSVGASERPKSAFDAFIEDIKASREDLKKQQAQDKYMALLSAGLGMMSGTSPNAFANIGQGAQAGVASYAASQKQRAAERAALNKNLLMGQRYQSMEDIAGRTADINEMRYREAAAARAAGSGDAASLKQERILDQREAALARAIQQGQATVANALKTQFGDTGMYTNKAAFEKAYKDLTDRYVTPHVLKRNQLDQQRFPDIFGTNAQQPAGGSSSTVIKYDNKGNPIQ